MPIEAPYAYVVWEGLRIVVTHGDAVMSDAEKDAMAKHLKADLFISGHIHQTILEKRGATVFLNPRTGGALQALGTDATRSPCSKTARSASSTSIRATCSTRLALDSIPRL